MTNVSAINDNAPKLLFFLMNANLPTRGCQTTLGVFFLLRKILFSSNEQIFERVPR